MQPSRCTLNAQRKWCRQQTRTARLHHTGCFAQKGLCQQQACVGTNRHLVLRTAWWEESNALDTHMVQDTHELVFHHIGQSTHNQQFLFSFIWARWHVWHHRCQASVLTLGEGGFDSASRIIQHAHSGRMLRRKPRGSAG